MNNTKKSRKTFRMSEDLKDILKCVLIWGIILIFASYLLADAEILGNVKQQERPETSVMIGAEVTWKKILSARPVGFLEWNCFFLQKVRLLPELFV